MDNCGTGAGGSCFALGPWSCSVSTGHPGYHRRGFCAVTLEDYALIGDCETAALVGRDGSIDWLCFPRFDSPACFAALLGTPENGRWLVAPTDEIRATRRKYRDGTLVLETEFETAHGTAAVIDCMSPRTEVPDVIRIVEGRRGEVRFRLELIIRFDYGSLVPWVRRVEDGLVAVGGPDAVYLATPVKIRGENFHTVAEFTVHAGEQVPFVLTWYPSHRERRQSIEPPNGVAETERWWRAWSDRAQYAGDYREAVLTSLLTLKATYAPTGGIADNMVLLGRLDEARGIFERLLGIRNDVGLLAEEYDPAGHRFLGNFPQAFTHVGLVVTAMNLSRGTAQPAQDRSHG